MPGIPRGAISERHQPKPVIVGFPGSRLGDDRPVGRYQETSNVFYNVNSPFGVKAAHAPNWARSLLGGVQVGSRRPSDAVTPITAREFLGCIGRAFFGRAATVQSTSPRLAQDRWKPFPSRGVRTRGPTGSIPTRVLPQVNPAPGLYDQVPIQLPAMPVVPKQLPTIDGPGKIMPTPQGPIGLFGPARQPILALSHGSPLSRHSSTARSRSSMPMAGPSSVSSRDTLRAKRFPAVNPDLAIEGMHAHGPRSRSRSMRPVKLDVILSMHMETVLTIFAGAMGCFT